MDPASPTLDPELDRLLAGVSRSFYLSLRVLPSVVRPPLSLAYLVARAADTIADTAVVRAERRWALLDQLLAALDDPAVSAPFAATVRSELGAGATSPGERLLLERLGGCLAALHRLPAADRARIAVVLGALTDGMATDLARFPDPRAPLAALATLDELDQHCYAAAGCVGEFWTRLTAAHLPTVAHLTAPAWIERGVRLGKALQLVNVIRDAPADLAAGRCYLPTELLAHHHLTPAALLTDEGRAAAAPVLAALHRLALDHADAAWPYVEAIPPTAPRLRLACVWPLWIGLATLRRLDERPPLDPHGPVKVTRAQVYALVAQSTAVAPFTPLLGRLHRRYRAAAEPHSSDRHRRE